MKIEEIRVFIKPDLLLSEAGFEKIKEYFSENIPEDFTMFTGLKDGKLEKKSALSDGNSSSSVRSMATVYAINGGYWMMSLKSIHEFIGLP